MLLIFTILPLRSHGKYGSTACVNSIVPSTLIRYTRSHSSTFNSPRNAFDCTPALLIRMSTRNSLSPPFAAATIAAQPASVLMSARTGTARTPCAAASSCASAAAAASDEADAWFRTSAQPLAARLRATAAPMPREPPETMASLPSRERPGARRRAWSAICSKSTPCSFFRAEDV